MLIPHEVLYTVWIFIKLFLINFTSKIGGRKGFHTISLLNCTRKNLNYSKLNKRFLKWFLNLFELSVLNKQEPKFIGFPHFVIIYQKYSIPLNCMTWTFLHIYVLLYTFNQYFRKYHYRLRDKKKNTCRRNSYYGDYDISV